MSKERRFFICSQSGNIAVLINNGGEPLESCGKTMKELTPNTVEASVEKHLPSVSIHGNTVEVQVGTVPHPMEDIHYIQWIYLETKRGGQIKYLEPKEEPKATFVVEDDELIAVYEYCNIHGLWKTEIK